MKSTAKPPSGVGATSSGRVRWGFQWDRQKMPLAAEPASQDALRKDASGRFIHLGSLILFGEATSERFGDDCRTRSGWQSNGGEVPVFWAFLPRWEISKRTVCRHKELIGTTCALVHWYFALSSNGRGMPPSLRCSGVFLDIRWYSAHSFAPNPRVAS